MGEEEMKVISIINEKGGVGKTATATNLSRALVLMGHSVLLIDLDKGGFSGSCLGVKAEKQTAYNIFIGGIDFEELPTLAHGIHVIPGCDRISDLSVKTELKTDQYFVLTKFLEKLPYQYDYTILDCGGDRLVYLNALVASTDIIVTVQAEPSSAEGLLKAVTTIKEVWEYITDKPRFLGILLTMYDDRLNRHNLTVSQIQNGDLKEKVLKTIIRRNINIADAMGEKLPTFDFKPSSSGAADYKKLAKEVISRIKECDQS